MRADITTGLWWQFQKSLLRIPVGITERRLGNDELGHGIHIDPSYLYNFCRYFSLRLFYSFSNNNYYDGEYRDLQNHLHVFELRPMFFPDGRRHVIAPYIGYNNFNAEAGKYSYDGPYYGVSYFGLLPTRTELILNYRWTQKHYDSEAEPYYDRRRRDRHQQVIAGIKQRIFIDNLYASFMFDYTDNDSNLELYEYTRSAYTLGLEYRF
jgi:hypothetical protein